MENTTYIGLSRLSTMRREMDVIANNLANMNSNAYKGERVMFEEYLKGANQREKMSFVNDFGVLRDFRAGKLEQTGNSLDLAINGPGYLTVDTPQGRRYTRDGHLRLDADRRLVTSGGHPVLDNRGREIVFPEDGGAPSISADGTITVGEQQLGKIDLVTFDNEQELRKTAQGLYATAQEPVIAPANSTLVQGMLEASNVEPIVEMTNMIELLRQYQSTQTMLESEHERVRNAIQRLGRQA
ncbi:flagellar basal-body rod protein FlgF [uncultured Ferrovibrio sp.]|jgi:flagellar basal-body rod protein FlgF|uniref:flagellar basal-body rod protein FlgF n=1 Tax=uncultured Ferrovibrio sp. TaxID=1576913 RepID=UPI00260433B5|nr:flagellar basal-body rod protein FlgF [uncultured Ferrovibrio sp.]